MNDMYIVATVAILGLSSLGTAALAKGINGKLLTSVVGAICTVVGFAFGQAV
ncbi:hypothetical protein KAR91_29695 [Candidatus Pacearchaeota archaeon]|nr:hypothetical protein [Candidatus Pacearchaeota archaeon]